MSLKKAIIVFLVLISYCTTVQSGVFFPEEIIVKKSTSIKEKDKPKNIKTILKSKKRIWKEAKKATPNEKEFDNKYGVFALACIIGSFAILIASITFANITMISAISLVGAYVFVTVFVIGAILAFLGQKRDENPRLAKRIWNRVKVYGFLVLVLFLLMIS